MSTTKSGESYPRLACDIAFYGMAGSGKTTQAERIADYFGAHHFYPGRSLREIAQEDTELGRQMKEIIDRGDFPDDDTHLQLYQRGVNGAHPDQPVVFEGAGRLPRLKKILDRIEKERRRDYIVIFLHLDEATAIERITRQGKRGDQSPAAIRNRLEIYNQTTLPVIDQHRQERTVIDINGSPDPDTVTRNIIQALQPFIIK